MRTFSATCVLVLATAGLGCADASGQFGVRENEGQSPPPNTPTPNEHGPGAPQTLSVTGTIQGSEKGNSDLGLAGQDVLDKAVKLIISILDPTGKLVPVGEGTIFPGGKYALTLDSKDPAALYVLSVVDIGNAVIGSAVLNGIPAFAKGFLLDIPIDTLTSYKTQVLMTIQSGGVPGVQNYINVTNAFLDDELAGWLVVGSAFVSDYNAILGSVSKSIVASENAMVSLLQAAGLPVDITAITGAQLATLSGVQGFVTNSNGQTFTTTKNLLMALEEASASGAAPVDKALFNAVVGGGAMFNSTLKSLLPAQMGGGVGAQNTTDLTFSIFKSIFKVEAMASLETIHSTFDKASVEPKVAEAVKSAGKSFMTKIEQAKDMKGLADAKTAYVDMLLGKQATPSGNVVNLLTNVVSTLQQVLGAVTTTLAPVTKDLATTLNAPSLTSQDISGALAKFDASTESVAKDLEQALPEKHAKALAEAITSAAKVCLP